MQSERVCFEIRVAETFVRALCVLCLYLHTVCVCVATYADVGLYAELGPLIAKFCRLPCSPRSFARA